MQDSAANQIDQLAWFIIPEFKSREHTFLDIANIGYRENSISAIYAYFLSHKNKDISQLFIETLVGLIQKQDHPFAEFVLNDEYVCYLEYVTNKGKRIDILIESIGNSEKSAIIIENKIFHFLANDLDEYWSSVIAQNKAGVVLTLRKEVIKAEFKDRFISITHSEWCNAISARGIPTSITPKEFIYLTDFLNNMNSIINSPQSEEARFFFDHPEKILRAVDVYNKAKLYVDYELKKLAEKMNFELQRTAFDYRYLKEKGKQSTIHYSLIIDQLITPELQIIIIIEFSNELVPRAKEIRNFLEEQNCYRNDLERSERGEAHWAHIASKTYQLKKEDWNGLSNFLFTAIETDFSQAMNLIIKEIYG